MSPEKLSQKRGLSESMDFPKYMFDHHFPREVAIFGGEMPDIQTHPTIISIYFAHCTPIFFPIVIGEHFKYGEIIGIQLTYDYPYDYLYDYPYDYPIW